MSKIPEEFLPPKELWPEYTVPEEFGSLPGKINLGYEFLDRNIEKGFGNKVAVKFQDKEVTYNELKRDSDKLANSLKKLGIGEQDRVALRGTNTPESIITNFAIMKIGAIPVPLSPLWSHHEIAYAVNNSVSSAIFVSVPLLPAVEKAAPSFDSKIPIIVIGGNASETEAKGLYSYKNLVDSGDENLEYTYVSPEDIGVLLYTSGTTGAPKGAVHFAKELIYEADIVGKYVWKFGESDVLGGAAPVSFAAGYGTFAIIPFRNSGTISLIGKFKPEEMMETIQKHKITILTGLPTAYRKLLEMKNFDSYDISSLRMCTTGGDALGPETFNAWKKKTGIQIIEGLGATEMVHLVTSNAVAKTPNPRSIGLALPGFKLAIFKETGEICTTCTHPGEIGLLGMKGPTGALYWRPYIDNARLLKEQQARVKNGWNILGDAVYQDLDGFVYFVARDSDVIKSSGYRIGPAEVEDVIKKHEKVKDCGVVGVPDSVMGEKTKAFIVLEDGVEPSDELTQEILDFCKEYIAVYKLPREVEYIDALPRTATGKLLRRMLRNRQK